MDWSKEEPMKYWSLPANYSAARRKQQIDDMFKSGNYIYSLKTDGNWSRAIVGTDRNILQTRGISKTTGTYGEVQDKVKWWASVENAFKKQTVIIGEIYLEGGVDRDIGSILRCLPDKAINRQKNNPARWRIFDVLMYEGTDIHSLPIIERQKYIRYVEAKIADPLVTGVTYYDADESTYESLSNIFASGGEGIVLYKKDSPYQSGKRTAWMTCKIKKQLEHEADVFCGGYVPATRLYTGKYIESWPYWQNLKTGEIVNGHYYSDYVSSRAYQPITKNYAMGWVGAIQCYVYDASNNLVHVCDVSGISESLKEEIKQDPNQYMHMPMKVNAMEVTPDGSLRHPRFIEFRDDIEVKDCSLSKIIGA